MDGCGVCLNLGPWGAEKGTVVTYRVLALLALMALLCLSPPSETPRKAPDGATRAAFADANQFTTLALESREVAYRLHETRVSLPLEIPEVGVLEVAFGLDPLITDVFSGDASFRLVLEDETPSRTVLFESTTPLSDLEAEEFVWQELSIDVSMHAGKDVHLILDKQLDAQGSTPPNGELLATDLMYWSMPHLRPKKLKGKPNVILVSLDTVRADHVGHMGYTRETTPNLDKIAAQGCFFTTAISQAPWTTPSHFSLLTSTYPRVHLATDPPCVRVRRWDPTLPTLARMLQRQGYRTAAFTGTGTISARYGFFTGFDFYNESGLEHGRVDSDVEMIFGKALRWIRLNADRTFFLFVHTFEPHYPYIDPFFIEREGRPPSNPTERLTALYDGDIRKADVFLGRLVEGLEALGLADDTLLIVTSDHGEDLSGSHYPNEKITRGHGYDLYDEMLRVPLVLRGPGITPHEGGLTPQVRLIDVLPTILDYLGYTIDPCLQGESLRPIIEGGETSDRPAFSEAVAYGFPRESMRYKGFKYIHRLSDTELPQPWVGKPPWHELYDLTADPGERRNIASEHKELLDDFGDLVGTVVANPCTSDRQHEPNTPAVSLDDSPELIEALKALGYIE